MSRPRRWNALETEPLQDCAVFRVSRTLTESPHTGQRHAFFRIDSADWVNVVPVTSAGEIVMVRQYRHGLRDVTLEIPGGMVDAGETPEQAAARELLEETGYRAGTLAPLGSVNPNPALFGNRLFAFVARDCRRVAEIANENTEETVVELLAPAELRRLARAGRIDHGLVMAALFFFDLAREGDGPLDEG
jgi:8-oxo-dGTP pyrophosphatase MutT (NUDIX family)